MTRRVPPITGVSIVAASLGVCLITLAACGGNDVSPSTSTTPSTSIAPGTDAPSSTSSTTTPPVVLEQPALWPSASEVFTSPRDVAEDFLLHVFGIPPVIGDFMAGDSRSGEIEVYSPGEVPTVRGILLLRQLGPSSGWFIIGTVNDNALITNPTSGAEIDHAKASSVVVEGMAEGFEASLTVYAYVAGRAEILDQETTMGGNLGVPGPFQVTLDVSAAHPGDTVMLLVRGGVGLETDPGEFGAIPITIT